MTDHSQSDRVSDAPSGNWVYRVLPRPLWPFAQLSRFDRPIGWWLLLLPCWWSASLAADVAGRSLPDLWHMVLFWIGAVVMRGAGCTYNDMVDRDLDAAVERTRSRPIPSGRVTLLQARVWMVLQALVGFVVLIQFNFFTIALGIASLLIVSVYPFMKRITDWPQFVLGLAFSWGALMGWPALFGRLDWPPVLLYVGAIAWTVGYDTIYALQDKEDDALIGVRSTARLFGARTKPALVVFFALATGLYGLAYVTAGVGAFAYAGLIAGALHMAWQIHTLDADDPQNCLARFRANRDYGLIVLAGLLVDGLLSAA